MLIVLALPSSNCDRMVASCSSACLQMGDDQTAFSAGVVGTTVVIDDSGIGLVCPKKDVVLLTELPGFMAIDVDFAEVVSVEVVRVINVVVVVLIIVVVLIMLLASKAALLLVMLSMTEVVLSDMELDDFLFDKIVLVSTDAVDKESDVTTAIDVVLCAGANIAVWDAVVVMLEVLVIAAKKDVLV